MHKLIVDHLRAEHPLVYVLKGVQGPANPTPYQRRFAGSYAALWVGNNATACTSICIEVLLW